MQQAGTKKMEESCRAKLNTKGENKLFDCISGV